MSNFDSRISFIISTNSVTVLDMEEGKTHVVNNEQPNYQPLRDAIRAKDVDGVLDNLSIASTINRRSGGRVVVTQRGVFVDDKEVRSTLAARIVTMYNDGTDYTPLLKFLERVEQNPDYDSRQRLFDFLDASNLPITPNGTFLAYKKVNADFTSIHDNSFSNAPGETVSMPRRDVDSNPNHTCSAGLHVCSQSYLPHFGWGSGNKVVLCEVAPENVVTVPTDYQNAKMRVCEYKVLREVPGLLQESEYGFTSNYTEDDGWGDDDDDDDWDEWDTDGDGDYDWDDYNNRIDDMVDEIRPSSETQLELDLGGGSTVQSGSASGGSLSDAEVRLIRTQFDDGMSKAAIGRYHDISPRTVGRIVNRESYAHVV